MFSIIIIINRLIYIHIYIYMFSRGLKQMEDEVGPGPMKPEHLLVHSKLPYDRAGSGWCDGGPGMECTL